ncbi:MAG: hypothetical protein ACLR6I_17140 [Waltera sp.]
MTQITFEEESTDAIDFSSCIFENINISAKGNIRLGTEGFKEVSKEFGKKALPIVKCIATTTLQTCVESSCCSWIKDSWDSSIGIYQYILIKINSF